MAPRARAVSTARSSAPSAVRASPAARRGEQLEGVVVDLRRVGDAALGVGQRSPHQLGDLLGPERAQLVDLRAREQRGVDLEVRVLGGRPDQGHEAVLDRRQQSVLLGLVEAVDLVEEEDRRRGRFRGGARGRARSRRGPRPCRR